HTFTVLSTEPLARRVPSGLKATLLTPPICPLSLRVSWPVAAYDTDHAPWPSWLTAKGASWPVTALHTFTVLSSEPLARRVPSGLKATLLTPAVCPLSMRVSWPVAASHIFTVPSPEPLARRLPSGLKATLLTPAVCPLSMRVSCPV